MIAFANPGFVKPKSPATTTWQERFLLLLPAIRRHAQQAFYHLDDEAREEAVQEVVANALKAFARLVERGEEERAYPSILTNFAIRQFRAGRRVVGKVNVRDVLSEACRLQKGLRVDRLDHFDGDENEWREAVVNDPRTSVFHQVWFRIDFPAWLAQLPRRTREIALTLSKVDSTGEVAQRFKISPGRVSQLRRELSENWHEFHARVGPTGGVMAAA